LGSPVPVITGVLTLVMSSFKTPLSEPGASLSPNGSRIGTVKE
jgi:hypothetical protein